MAQTKKNSNSNKLFEIDEHIVKRYDIKERLGKGAYGIVWKAIDRKTRSVVAVKKIFDAFRNRTDAQRTFREVMFLLSLRNHPNIIKLFCIHRASNNSDIYLGFEYMDRDLHEVIKKGILKNVHIQYIMFQLLRAVRYIHSGNIIHRDLKPSNILIDATCRCKIADFGLARSLTQTNSQEHNNFEENDPTLTDYVATRWYRAPEILIANRRYTKGVDMWSVGCILGEICAGKPLFPGTSTVNQVEKIMATINTPSTQDIRLVCISEVGSSMIQNAALLPKVPLKQIMGTTGTTSNEAIGLIKQLLVFNPNSRLTAEEALKHDYLGNFRYSKKDVKMSEDVVIPFSDDVRLSVDNYRSKLYETMSAINYPGGTGGSNNNTNCKLAIHGKHLQQTISTKQYQKSPASVPVIQHQQSKKSSLRSFHPDPVHQVTKAVTHSEPKILINRRKADNNPQCVPPHRPSSVSKKINAVRVKSGSVVASSTCVNNGVKYIQSQQHYSVPSKIQMKLSSSVKSREKKVYFNNTANCCSCKCEKLIRNPLLEKYNQTHGVIDHRTLMALKVASLH